MASQPDIERTMSLIVEQWGFEEKVMDQTSWIKYDESLAFLRTTIDATLSVAYELINNNGQLMEK